jgi:hypothetical protein
LSRTPGGWSNASRCGDESGHDIGVGYEYVGPGSANANVFVFPARESTLEKELANALAEVASVHEVHEVSRQMLTACGMVGLGVRLVVTPAKDARGGNVPSWLWMFEADRWLTKVRCTARQSAVPDGLPEALERLVTAIGPMVGFLHGLKAAVP